MASNQTTNVQLPPPAPKAMISPRGGTPRYAQATAAAAQRDYANREQDTLNAAFRPNSHRSLRSGITSPTTSTGGGGAFRTGGPKTGVALPPIEYISSPFSAARDALAEDRRRSDQVIASIHGQNFKPASSRTKRDLSPTGAAEDRPRPPDPYELAEIARREDLATSVQLRLAGPFRPTGNEDRITRRPTRARIDEILVALCHSLTAAMQRLESAAERPPSPPRVLSPTAAARRERELKKLQEDTANGKAASAPAVRLPRPTVLCTANDLLVVRYPADQRGSGDALLRFMSDALRLDTTIVELGLAKVPGAWGIEGDGGAHVLFFLRPSWVHIPPTRLQPTSTNGESTVSMSSGLGNTTTTADGLLVSPRHSRVRPMPVY